MNLAPLLAGSENDLSDKGAKGFRGLPAAVCVIEGFGQAFHTKAVEIGNVRMNVQYIGRCMHHTDDNLGLLPLKIIHPGFHTCRPQWW